MLRFMAGPSSKISSVQYRLPSGVRPSSDPIFFTDMPTSKPGSGLALTPFFPAVLACAHQKPRLFFFQKRSISGLTLVPCTTIDSVTTIR